MTHAPMTNSTGRFQCSGVLDGTTLSYPMAINVPVRLSGKIRLCKERKICEAEDEDEAEEGLM